MAIPDPELPRQMKAQFLESFNTPYSLRSTPIPTLTSSHDILIKVDAASYCHTDAVLAAGHMPTFPESAFPHIGCHEFAGTVVDAPAASPFRKGDRVGVPGRSFHPCGTCFECSSGDGATSSDHALDPPGYSVYCPHSLNNGISRPGGFAEYAVVDGRQVAPVPDGLSALDTATLMCAGVTVFAAVKRCGLGPGQRLGIMGVGGGLGHLGLQFAAHMGLRVVGVDVADGPLRLARDVAARLEGKGEVAIVDARATEAADVVVDLGRVDGKQDRGDMGLDAVLILPESQEAFDYGVALLRNHGKCVVVSFPKEGFRVAATDVVFRDISIVGSLVGSNKMLRETVKFADQHDVRAQIKTYPLSRLNDLVDEYHKGEGGKLVVDMNFPDSM